MAEILYRNGPHHPPGCQGTDRLGQAGTRGQWFPCIAMDAKGRIILEPFTEIPASETWLFENKPALAAVKEGLS